MMTINPFKGHRVRTRRTRNIGLKVSLATIALGGLLVCLSAVRLGAKQDSAAPVPAKPIETTVCEILENPAAYNNKLVRVRGRLSVDSESAVIEGYGCSHAIWFTYPDGSGPPGMIATTLGRAVPGGTNSQGVRVAPIRVNLVFDSNFRKFQKFATTAAKAQNQADEQYEKDQRSRMVFYGVIATFIGRIDGVSAEVHAAHLKRSPNDLADWKGFGQMGMYDAELVLQSVQGPFEIDMTY
ncbi:MAG: hypothetical protein WA405_05760 [Candidatus Acidiferrales bacterium]